MLGLIAENLRNYSDRNSFCITNEFFSYAELGERVQGYINKLNDTNSGSRLIGILTSDGLDTYAAILAVLFSGNAFVPLNPRNPASRNDSIIKQAGLEIVISTWNREETGSRINSHVEFIYSVETPGEKYRFKFRDLDLESNAYLLFTSGSTGVPKGVPITHHNLNAFLEGFFALGYELDSNDRFLQMFDISFDLSIMSYLVPLIVGGCVYPVASEGIQYMQIYQLFEEHELTFALMVPSVLSHLRSYFPEIRLPKLKYCLFCGEALYDDITAEWAGCLPNALIQNVYGPTEATIFCTAFDWKQNNSKLFNGIVCIGKAMKDVHLLVVDDMNNPLPSGEKGELCLGGGQTTPGYWNDPEKNKLSFFNYEGVHFYKTGDIAFKDQDGDYFFLGRKDHQVKVQGGYRVELSEIEHYVREFLPANNAVALALETDIGIASICLVTESYQEDFEELKLFLKKNLPHYMVPMKYLNLDEFPLNTNGKTDRKKITEIIKG